MDDLASPTSKDPGAKRNDQKVAFSMSTTPSLYPSPARGENGFAEENGFGGTAAVFVGEMGRMDEWG